MRILGEISCESTISSGQTGVSWCAVIWADSEEGRHVETGCGSMGGSLFASATVDGGNFASKNN